MKMYRIFVAACVICVAVWFLFQPKIAGNYDEIGNSSTASLQSASSSTQLSQPQLATDWLDESRSFLKFARFNFDGAVDRNGSHYVIAFNPKSTQLDFQVIPGLAHEIGEILPDNQPRKEYKPYTFSQLIRSQNGLLQNSQFKNSQPFAAINADYINQLGQPQGLNISRGISYSGDFAQTRSSFAISGGDFASRMASIMVGSRANSNLQFNAAGGNGRFYTNGIFTDICAALGQFACNQSTNRSMAAVTSSGWVIWLVHDETISPKVFTPDIFDNVLQSVATYFELGTIRDAMLFDGGKSPAMLWNGQVVYSNPGSIGSIFALYVKE